MNISNWNGSVTARYPHDRTAELIVYYGHLVYPPILLNLCVIGNLANFIVIGKVCSGSSISVYFRWLALADTLAAFTYLTRIWIHAVFRVMINSVNDATCKVLNFTNYTAGDVAIWLMVAVTADRLVAIIKPFLARRLCTSTFATCTGVLILVFMAAKNSTILVSYGVVVRPKETKCGYRSNHLLTYFEKHVRPMLTLTLSGVIPVFLILLLNAAVVVQLVRHKREMRKRCEDVVKTSRTTSCVSRPSEPLVATGTRLPIVNRKCAEAAAKKKSSETAAVVIVLANSIMFFIMVLPQFIVNVFKQFPYGDELRAVQVFTTFLLYCNHSSNFYISLAASEAYRRKVRLTFGCLNAQRLSTTARYSTNTEMGQ